MVPLVFLACILFAAGLFPGMIAATAVPADHAVRLERGLKVFTDEVRPLLIDQCLKCHGGEKTKGEFDLATREGLLKGGAEGPSVVPFDPGHSRLMALLQHEKEPHMPSKAPKLAEVALQRIELWIRDGAPYDRPLAEGRALVRKDRRVATEEDRTWWAFQPLQRVEPPPQVPGVGADAYRRLHPGPPPGAPPQAKSTGRSADPTPTGLLRSPRVATRAGGTGRLPQGPLGGCLAEGGARDADPAPIR